MLDCKKIFKLLCLEHDLNFITTQRYPKIHTERMNGKFN